MKKGILVTTNMIIVVIMVVVAAMIILLLWGSFAAEAGSPVSNVFFKMLDWIVTLLPS